MFFSEKRQCLLLGVTTAPLSEDEDRDDDRTSQYRRHFTNNVSIIMGSQIQWQLHCQIIQSNY